jgi:hypothetical protein
MLPSLTPKRCELSASMTLATLDIDIYNDFVGVRSGQHELFGIRNCTEHSRKRSAAPKLPSTSVKSQGSRIIWPWPAPKVLGAIMAKADRRAAMAESGWAAYPVRSQTYSRLSSHSTSPPFLHKYRSTTTWPLISSAILPSVAPLG